MSKRTYVCAACRTTKRAEAAYGANTEFRCPKCNGGMFELPWEWRIPKINDDSAWEDLQELVNRLEKDLIPWKRNKLIEEITAIDKKLNNLKRQKDTKSNQNRIKKLETRKQETEKKYG